MAGITLTSKTINSTYDSLLKLTDNDGLTASFKKITDGLGNDSGISINNAGNVQVSGTLNVSGTTTIGSVLRGNATLTIDPAAHGDNTGLVVIAGDLQVDGTTTTINSTTVDIGDKNILLASDAANKAAANGAGITVETGTNDPVVTNATILYNGTDDTWDFNKWVTASKFVGDLDGDVTGNLTGNVTGTVSSISNHDTDDLSEGATNLYYTDTRFDNRFATKDTDDLSEGATNLYYTTARFDTDFATKDTDDLSEGDSNLYFTTARARGAFSEGTGVTITDGQIDIGQSVGTTDDVIFNQVTADLIGNADTATTSGSWTSAISLTLGGDASGSVSLDGSSNVTLNVSGVDAETIDGFDSTQLYRKVYGTAWQSTPSTRWVQFTVPYISGSGGSNYYYFDVVGYRDIGNMDSQLHYRVYIHSRGSGTNNNIVNYDIYKINEPQSEKFEFFTKGGGTTANIFVIKVGEDYSRVEILAIPTVNNVLGSLFSYTDTEPTGLTALGFSKTKFGGGIELNGTNNHLRLEESSENTWRIYDTFQDNGIIINSESGGMEFQYNGVTEMTINGSGVVFTGTIDLSNANLNIGSADIVFDTVSTNANRGLVWDVDGAYLSKLVSGGTNGGMVEIYTNMDDAITGADDVFRIRTGSSASIAFEVNGNGDVEVNNNFTSNGYLQAFGYLYTRDNLRVLNAAGTGWTTWATRSDGNYNLSVGSISATGDVNFNSGNITRIGNGGYDLFINGGVMLRDYGNAALTNGRFYYQADAWHFRGGGEGEADTSTNTAMYIRHGGAEGVVWHSRNDGSGSGLDADTLDGLQASQFLRSDTTDSMSGSLTLSGSINANNIMSANYTSLTGNSGEWFTIAQLYDSNGGSTIFTVSAYAHSSTTFIANDGYPNSALNHITVLDYMANFNGGFANVKGVRITDSGAVQIKLEWSSGPTVDVAVTAISNPSGTSLSTSLESSAPSDVRDTVNLTHAMLRSRGTISSAGDINASGNFNGTSAVLSNRLFINSTAPIIELKDTNSTGAAISSYISYKDSGANERGWVGFGSGTSTDFGIQNTIGDIRLYANTIANSNLTVNGDITVLGGTNGVYVNSSTHASLRVDRGSTTYDNNVLFYTAGALKWRLWQDGSDDYLYIRNESRSNNQMIWHQSGFTAIPNPPDAVPVLQLGRGSGQPNIKSSDSYAFMDSNGGWAALNWYSSDSVALAAGGGNVSVGSVTNSHKLYVSGNCKVASTLEHSGLNMTDGTNVDQIKTYTKSLQLSAGTWTDTGIDANDLETGTYIIQLYIDDYNVGGQQYSEFYSGIMSWFNANTNNAMHDEIYLHRAGHAPNNGDIQLRTIRTYSADPNNLKLQIKSRQTYSSADSMTFKFRRMI
jgi:hypothetical protein